MNRTVKKALLLAPTLMLATALLGGCTGAGAFPSASPSVSAATAKPAGDAARVAAAYEQFLNGLYSLDETQQKELALLAEQYPDEASFAKLSATKQANVVAEVKKIDPALAVLDVSSLDARQQFLSLSTLLYLGSTGSPTTSGEDAVAVVVNPKAVVVKGTTATVPLDAITFTIGKDEPAPYPTNAPIVAQSMPFEKIAGKWLIDGDVLAAQGATPTPAPSASGK